MKITSKLLTFVAVLALGAGYLVGNDLTVQGFINSVPFIQLAIVALIAVYSSYVHIILHELGHYVFGKMTGYQLIYFQLPYFRYEAKKKTFSKLGNRIPGMMGQCLMQPPVKGTYKEKPYFLYLAGGLIVNFITASLFYLGSFIIPGTISFTFFALSIPPFLLFMANVLPYGFTDGGVIRELRKSEVSRTLYFKQLELAALFEEGKEFSEIPDSYFSEIGDGTYTESKMGEYILLIAYQKYVAELDFEKADKLLQAYQANWNYLASPYARILASEILFIHAIFGRKKEAEQLMAQIESYPLLKNYYDHSKVTKAAYQFFVKTNVAEATKNLNQTSTNSEAGFNEAELSLRDNLVNWLESYLGSEVR